MMSSSKSYLEDSISRINNALLESLPEKSFSEITEAIHYSVMNDGKRMRPLLMLLMAEALEVDGQKKTVDKMAAAGELDSLLFLNS